MPVQLISAHKNKLKVAAYVRVSSTMEQQDESFETQASYYEKKIKANPNWEFAGVYGEKLSGTRMENRTSFNRMIRDAVEERKIDLILCKSVSRWARNAADAMETVRLLVGNHIHIFFEQEGIDTKQAGVVFQLNLAAAVAQAESESISENLKWIYRNRAAKGIFVPHKRKYFGFNTDEHVFKPDENAKYVREIFSLYLQGEGFTEIARHLNERGVFNRKGKPWRGESIKRILQNEVYVGDVRFQKNPSRNVITKEVDEFQISKYVKDHHEGIVSRNIWNRVQEKLKAPLDPKL